MKKIISTIAIGLCILTMFGCGKSSITASAKALNCATNAVDVAESYLSGKTDYSSAKDSIDNILSDLEYLDDQSTDDENYTADSRIKMHIFGLSIDLVTDNFKNNNESYDKVQDDIDEIKSDLKDLE